MRYTLIIATLFFAIGPVLTFASSEHVLPMPTVHVQKSDRLARSNCLASEFDYCSGGPVACMQTQSGEASRYLRCSKLAVTAERQ